MLAGDQVTVDVEADRDGVDDLERVDAFRLEISEADNHQPPSRSCTSGAANRSGSAVNGLAFRCPTVRGGRVRAGTTCSTRPIPQFARAVISCG